MVPSPSQAFAHADGAPELYVVVEGRVSYDPSDLPQTGDNDAPPLTEVQGRLSGRSLSRAGFTSPVDMPVTLLVGCAGPWCGTLQQGEVVAFVRKGDHRWEIDVGACPGSVFDATPSVRAEVMACMSGGC